MNRMAAIFPLVLAVATAGFSVSPAASQEIVELGRLECFIDEGVGFIVGSSKDISCVFTSNEAEWGEDNYFGVINRLGIDIGKTEEGYMSWLVVAGSLKDYKPGFLAGDYVGAGAEASFAVGLGANVLVGGSSRSIALQPLSVQAQKGLNFAAGIASLELRSIAEGE